MVEEVKTTLLAVAACLLICFGSLVAASAPGDGQTGMVLYPFWGTGAVLGLVSIARASQRNCRKIVWVGVALSALIALGSVVLAYQASMRYQRDRELQRSEHFEKHPILEN